MTVARLRQMAHALDLPLDSEDLTRLRPMVDDLIAVARGLRHYQSGGMGQPDPRHADAGRMGPTERGGPTPSSG
jgi:hypothetical protein